MKFLLRAITIAVTSLAVSHAWAKERYSITTPVIQKFEFNGIEATLTLAIRPATQPREMNDEQRKQYRSYRDLNNQCQGGNAGPKTDQACVDRDAMNLRTVGLCYGLQKDQSMAEMEWHPCLPTSNEYEAGSESVKFSCRQNGKQEISFRLIDDRLVFPNEAVHAESMVRIPATKEEFASEYSLSRGEGLPERVYHASFEMRTNAAQILYNLYDGERIAFPLGNNELGLTASQSLGKKVLDEVARMYSACKI